jgi:hypothetical protein
METIVSISEEGKKYRVKTLLETIEGISDKEYQKKVWIRGEGPECDDFCETVNNFSDDADPVLEDYRFYGLTETQYAFLKRFRTEFEIFYKEHHWEPEFIDSPEWHRITEMAKEVLKVFDYKKDP